MPDSRYPTSYLDPVPARSYPWRNKIRWQNIARAKSSGYFTVHERLCHVHGLPRATPGE